MKGKILAILLLSMLIIITASTKAATENVFEEQAAGYRYKVTIQDPSSKWEIGYKDETFIIFENENNKDYLAKYMNNVQELNIQIITLIIYTVYLILVFVITYLAKKKMKIKTSILVLIVFAFGIYAFINIIPAAIKINSSFNEANKYFEILAKNS
ncbi:hypothetical protein [Bacillus sp. T33-2]|uniref:hypothetical protein n=1 Tax=Bacillus sp. T33-2 TaxID=2054168 RepID=UPI000C7645DA|nr:hypothetical protein [Bacillus sp. T33-2]PLR98476.1 hypothetical protein CVD19_05190 [Bacillus sp. T33-2]